MNAKNIFQIYFQKRHLPIPKFTTYQIGGSDHQPIWQSRLVFQNQTFVSDPNLKKTNAEISLAEKVMAYITASEPTIHKKVFDADTAVLLIDLENLPNFPEQIMPYVQGLDVYAFVGSNHCLRDKHLPPGVVKIISPSTRPDGTDTCLQMYTALFLVHKPYDYYYIATRDHFGSGLVDMIKSAAMPWQPRRAQTVTRPQDICPMPTSLL